MGTKCNGCSESIYDLLFMECRQENCKKIYHMKCLMLSKKQFEEFTEQYKTNWRCPECMRDDPKGDNSDTPVRATAMNKTFTPSSYVNKQRGNRVAHSELRIETEEKVLEELEGVSWGSAISH
ncbi:jg13432 [Pararge aegeria aegeria]|uniref:Jg13432 protein n=1 Tax=Pararge aegeria aegeria TaxID=348720 RepID=A0A8S4QTC0_9NEOP|nr:jg13432 [Pararge aegeria aegeria]